MPSFFFTVNFKQLINNKIKLAKSQPNEIQHIKNFLKECGWLKDELKHTELEDVDFSEFELLKDFNQKDASEFLFSVVNEINKWLNPKIIKTETEVKVFYEETEEIVMLRKYLDELSSKIKADLENGKFL